MLELNDIDCHYGAAQVLHSVSLRLAPGEVLCLLGRNGAGKTTILRAIMGLMRISAGEILFDGRRIDRLPAHRVPGHGIGYVPQGRRLFAEMTVLENLQIGLQTRDHGQDSLAKVLEMFPLLKERLGQQSGTLSGGEQQMLAMGRALCVEPRLMLLDEPTEGLMPSMITAIRGAVTALKDQGVGIILVEQRVDAVLPVADRVMFVENGRQRVTVPVETLRDDPDLIHKYVGIGH